MSFLQLLLQMHAQEAVIVTVEEAEARPEATVEVHTEVIPATDRPAIEVIPIGLAHRLVR